IENEFKSLPDDSKLTIEQRTKLNAEMMSIRKTLDAEIQGYFVYMISPKRLDVTKLLEDVSALFTPNIYSELPAIAQKDFAAAGKCIAFSQPTAAAFHILRGTEDVVKHFYCTMIKQKSTIRYITTWTISAEISVTPLNILTCSTIFMRFKTFGACVLKLHLE